MPIREKAPVFFPKEKTYKRSNFENINLDPHLGKLYEPPSLLDSRVNLYIHFSKNFQEEQDLETSS